MENQNLVARARESVDAFNRSDWQAIREMAADDFVYEETGTGRRFSGADDIIAAMMEWKTAIPDGAGEIARILCDGDAVAMEVQWRGTHTGPLSTPAGLVPPTGKAIEVWAAVWQMWNGDKLRHERHHLDMLTFLTQLGLAPSSPAPV